MESESAHDEALLDQWPESSPGIDWDGANLLQLVEQDNSPFGDVLDVKSLVSEVEEGIGSGVSNIPRVYKGANFYGFHIQLHGKPDVIARVSRHDVNGPDFGAQALEKRQARQTSFELATYKALQPLDVAFSHGPIYSREPLAKQVDDRKSLLHGNKTSLTKHKSPRGILGRRIFLFEKAPGEHYDYGCWRALSPPQKSCLLEEAARLAATLFRFTPPHDFCHEWLTDRILGPQNSDLCRHVVAPTRDFCAALLDAKIQATLLRVACRWPSLASLSLGLKDTLKELVPHVLPRPLEKLDEAALYRFVLDHGDYGIHNMTVAIDGQGCPLVTSVYDWEAGTIVPVILSEPKMVVTADLTVDEQGEPSISRWGDGDTPSRMSEYAEWSRGYYKELFAHVPEYREAIRAGRHLRHIWFALRNMDKGCTEPQLFELMDWAGAKMAAVGVDGAGRAD
ncbi:hypothetical protein HIM_04123 [Hirsutella minnesotensis 3608]|uniref:Uncharacterized protein n=1 Tax=Hirsutella minnesotensis 3608 TaxID=1043627 RepID=A0A0F8A636_9HYPO|nr:hypothetical protein HIM_04123 [Hirsutella minnesotensis 3608]